MLSLALLLLALPHSVALADSKLDCYKEFFAADYVAVCSMCEVVV